MSLDTLAIETGRYYNIPPENRICTLCNENFVEDESHFLLYCKLYKEERKTFFAEIQRNDKSFMQKDDNVKLNILMDVEYIKQTAKFLYTCFSKRRSVLYN